MLGYDENHKPRAARFPASDAELVTKAAQLMDLRVYEAASEDLAALAKKLPEGRLYGNGRGFVPNVRQSLYSEIIVTLAVEPQEFVRDGRTAEPAGQFPLIPRVSQAQHWRRLILVPRYQEPRHPRHSRRTQPQWHDRSRALRR